MVLNVGIVSAFIVYKNRPGAMTRLEKLKKKLSQKPISQKTLHSYPVKKLFSIFIILCFMVGLLLFLKEYKLELHEKYQLSSHEQAHKIQKINQQFNKNQSFFHFFQQKNTLLPEQIHNEYLNVESTIRLIILFLAIPLMILIRQLNYERLIVKRRGFGESQQISGHIEKQEFSILKGWQTMNNLECKQNDLIFIELCGQYRFTNTDYYYAIKKVSKKVTQDTSSSTSTQQTLLKNTNTLNQDLIITKGNIFQARKNLIYICHILNKQINLSIKNGPVKDSKKPIRKNKTKKKQNT